MSDEIQMLVIGGSIGAAIGTAPLIAGLYKRQIGFAVGSFVACAGICVAFGWLITLIISCVLTAVAITGASSFRLASDGSAKWSKSETLYAAVAVACLGIFIIASLIWLALI
jgi:hypothetical protein